MNNQIIGGMFGLDNHSEPNNQFPPFLKNKEIFLANARSGINILVTTLRPQKVWMPSFLCDVMLKAVQDVDVQFYEVDSHLQISRGWLNSVENGELVIFIDYFGFPFDQSIANQIRKKGGWILEDASQALLSSHVGTVADFVLFSPRKFLSVPDGGILRSNINIDFSEIQLINSPVKWWLRALEATILRREYDLYGGERHWFSIFQDTDKNGPIGYYKMSELSKILIENRFDYSSIIQKRRANYEALNNYLGKIALFPDLPDDVVPLGFPIYLHNRDYVRNALFENQIYPPVHWPISGIVPENFTESHKLADMVLTLVCDQRYTISEMEKTAKIVLRTSI